MMEEQHRSRSLSRETSRVGQLFQVSNNEDTLTSAIDRLRKMCEKSTSDRLTAHYRSKINLLKELHIAGYMPLHEAFDEYMGYIPKEFQPIYTLNKNALQVFVDSILSRAGGLPLVIVNCPQGERYITLHQDSTKQLLCVIDAILCRASKQSRTLDKLAEHWPGLLKLTTSSRERALLVSTLALTHSGTSLRFALNISEDISAKAKAAVLFYADALLDAKQDRREAAKKHWADTVSSIEKSLQCAEEKLQRTESRLHFVEKESQKQDILNKRNRLQRMKIEKEKYIHAVAARSLKQWKTSLLTQRGKGKGRTVIDRGAEDALLGVLEEQMVAHARRKGVAELERRLQRKEMRFIANTYLAEHGKRLVKSYETPRSWAKARNTRSIQAKQHRGRSMFSHRKAKKVFTVEHINIHYNRAHIKAYTRRVFSRKNKRQYQRYTVRHCFDDKAYLRCGTSEGFCRPSHAPIISSSPELQPTLPCYDFPDSTGYIAPGVHLFINDMTERDIEGQDKFAISDATISVTCKPKLLSSSSATSWSNHAYVDRIRYPEEHEVEGSGENESRGILSPLILLRDSARQFQLSNIPRDFERCTEAGDHLRHEICRVSVLRRRLELAMAHLGDCRDNITGPVTDTLSQARMLESWLQKNIAFSKKDCRTKYHPLTQAVNTLENILSDLVPKYRPCDIQTTDAGPGVGVSEKMVQLRLVENFLINDLDFQCRMHYAPRDSKSHPVERVMASLNDAVGDGRFIDLHVKSLTEAYAEEELLNMTSEQVKEAEKRFCQQASSECAEKLAARYEGTSCMGTSIHAHVPDQDSLYTQFFYDEEDMLRWHRATPRQKASCPGSHYYTFLVNTFENNFIKYDNGVEGIRVDGDFRCPGGVERLPPPVPDMHTQNKDGTWRYHTEGSLPQCYTDVKSRDVDDFCPRAQMNKLIKACGPVQLSNKQQDDGQIVLHDLNDTWNKISSQLPKFVETICGKDLNNNAVSYAECVYLREVKRAIAKLALGKVKHGELMAIKSGPLKLKITKRK